MSLAHLASPRRLLVFAGVAAAAAALAAQQANTYSVDVNVVNVLVTVRDKHSKIVNNLGQNDFTLEEDGRPQIIRYFSRETDLPLTLGLLVDTSLSQRRVLEPERSASGKFFDQVLREDKDHAFLIHFDREVELLQDLTNSRQRLDQALNLLETPALEPEPRSGGGSPGGRSPRGSGYPGGGYPRSGGGGAGRGQSYRAGTLLYDAVFLASDELMQKQQGRKAVIVLSDGVDRGSKTSLERAIETAQRSNTIVYAILFKDDRGYGGGWERGGMGGPWGGRRGGGGYPRSPRQEEERPDGKKILERMAAETGGRMFEVSKKEPLEQVYQQIQEELRNQYNLGYTPDRAPDTAEYHRIRVTAKGKDLVVQAQDGYYSGAPSSGDPGKAQVR